MVSAVYDFAAIAKQCRFGEDRPQNEVKPVEKPESPAYSYSSGDLAQQTEDYGMFAGFGEVKWVEVKADSRRFRFVSSVAD